MSGQLKHKLIDYAAEPPAGAWHNIAARLDDDALYSTVAGKISGIEILPPAQTFSRIVDGLEETAPVKFLPKRNVLLNRFAAAAAVAVILAGSWLLINRRAADKNLAKKNTIQPVAVSTGRNDTSTSMDGINIKSSTIRNENGMAYAIISNPGSMHPVAVVTAPRLKNSYSFTEIHPLSKGTNYLLVANPAGQLTRISSKFSNVIRFLNGSQDAADYSNALNDENNDWKDRFNAWRIKITQSAYIPASGNFLDIMELKDLIQEEK